MSKDVEGPSSQHEADWLKHAEKLRGITERTSAQISSFVIQRAQQKAATDAIPDLYGIWRSVPDGKKQHKNNGLWGVLKRLGVAVLVAAIAGIFFSVITHIVVGGMAFAIVLVLGVIVALIDHKERSPVEREFVRGSSIVDRDGFLRIFVERQPTPFIPAMLATVPFPKGAERLHTLVSASTGAGKSQTLLHLLASIRARGERAVILDNGGEFSRTFKRDTDISVSPDGAVSGVGWSIANEARSRADWERFATSWVPAGEGNSREWCSMARALFAAVGRQMWEVEGSQLSNAKFYKALSFAPAETVAAIVAGTSASQLVTGTSEKADNRLQNVRMTFADSLKAFDYMAEGEFSFRRWMSSAENAGQWLFVPYRDFSLPISKQAIGAWCDILVSAALEDGVADSAMTTWLIIDELDSLGNIESLVQGVTRLRKAGVAVVACVQDHAQLRSTYGRERSSTIINNMSNKVILRTTDYDAADTLSKQIGDVEYFQSSQSGNNAGISVSHSYVKDRVVMASEIQRLPDLNGYVVLSGDWPAIQVKVPIFNYNTR